MHSDRLHAAEQAFFHRYPGGFEHPDLVAVGKKHKVSKMIELASECFAEPKFDWPHKIAEDMVKVICRSSMVSLFEKPKFRDAVKSADEGEIIQLSEGLYQFLYGDQEKGLNTLVATLLPHKLAKWSLITIIPNYVFPNREVFVKPTTAKGVVNFFELDHLKYTPRPYWDFYKGYREAITEMKQQLNPSLSPSNAAFCGFLMMNMKEQN